MNNNFVVDKLQNCSWKIILVRCLCKGGGGGVEHHSVELPLCMCVIYFCARKM